MTNYSDAVEALASGLSAKSGDISRERKGQLARSLLQQDDIEGLDEWSELELDLSSSASTTLQNYLGELQEAYNSEIGHEINSALSNARNISDLRNRLQREINRAMGESKELESIAQRLQDSGLGKIAGREEREVNELGGKLEQLNAKTEEVERLEEKLLGITNGLGIGHDEIHRELEKRSNVVGQLIRRDTDGSGSGSGPDISEPWQLVAENPGKEPDWTKNSFDIWKDGWSWIHTTPRGSVYNWMVKDGPTASQGWKIHIAVNPDNEDEILRVAKAVMPVLNSMSSENKFARNAGSLKNKGGETAVKLVTIYPQEDSSPSDTVNQNRQTTEKLVGELVNALEAEGLLAPSTIVKTLGEFNVSKNGNPTRVFVRYDKLGSDEVVDNDGNHFGGKKPGAVPVGMSSRTSKDISEHDIDILPELQPPSFDIYLPSANYDK